MEIIYRFIEADGTRIFPLEVHPVNLSLQNPTPDELPDWTALDFHKCPHCPLRAAEQPHCPVAAHLVNLVEYGNRLPSHFELLVEVITQARTVSRRASAQDALSSLMGLITATSGCPHTLYLRPMARFHLPFADGEETIYRAVSMYLLAQYFLHKRGETADLELAGLGDIYRKLHTVNVYLAKRLQSCSKEDSAVNALTRLSSFSLSLPRKIQQSLEDMALLFEHYLQRDGV